MHGLVIPARAEVGYGSLSVQVSVTRFLLNSPWSAGCPVMFCCRGKKKNALMICEVFQVFVLQLERGK